MKKLIDSAYKPSDDIRCSVCGGVHITEKTAEEERRAKWIAFFKKRV